MIQQRERLSRAVEHCVAGSKIQVLESFEFQGGCLVLEAFTVKSQIGPLCTKVMSRFFLDLVSGGTMLEKTEQGH